MIRSLLDVHNSLISSEQSPYLVFESKRTYSQKRHCLSNHPGPVVLRGNCARVKWTMATAALATVAATKKEPGSEHHRRPFKVVIFGLDQRSFGAPSRVCRIRRLVSIQRQLRVGFSEAGGAEAVLIGHKWTNVW